MGQGPAAHQLDARALGGLSVLRGLKICPSRRLDHFIGCPKAFAAQAALLRQRTEGGAWHVGVGLARTGEWLRGLGRVENGFAVSKPSAEPHLYTEASGFGQLTAMRHSAKLSRTPEVWKLPFMPPGIHPPQWW